VLKKSGSMGTATGLNHGARGRAKKNAAGRLHARHKRKGPRGNPRGP